MRHAWSRGSQEGWLVARGVVYQRTRTHVAVVEVYFDSCRDGRSQLDGWLGTHGLDHTLEGDDQEGNQHHSSHVNVSVGTRVFTINYYSASTFLIP